MQVHGQSNVAAVSAGFSMPNAVPSKTGALKSEQPQPEDQITLSPAAKEISKNVSNVSNTQAAPANAVQNAEKAIASGNYTVLGTSSAGRVVVVLVDPLFSVDVSTDSLFS